MRQHTVHVTRTMTTTTYTGIVLNLGFIKKPQGILKLSQLILGIICIAISGHYFTNNILTRTPKVCYFLTTSVTFFTTTLLLIISNLFSLANDTLMRKSLFEVLYNGLAFILYFAASVVVLVEYSDLAGWEIGDAFVAAGSLALINSILYAVGAIESTMSFRAG